jgi:uncharacterized protein YfiM (DUF2279 family)
MKNWLAKGKHTKTIFYTFIFLVPFPIFGQSVTIDSNIVSSEIKTFSASSKPNLLVNKDFGTNSIANNKRIKLVAAANIIGYGGTMIGLYSDWYKNYPQSSFHFFDDNNEWKQVDKVGHAFSAYIEGYGSMEMWRWAGVSRRKSALIGGLSALAYQSIIETMDGFSTQWGWSWGDMAANVTGAGLLIGQELKWNEQRIKFKFSFHKKDYGSPDLNMRANSIYGNSLSERLIKDYNGQTYWLSGNLKSFMPQSNLPAWLSVAFGYGAEGMFGAESNIASDNTGNTTFNRGDIARYRQYYISPDIDLTKIKTHSKFLKLAFGALNAFKFPLPSVEYNSRGKFAFHLIHF